MKKHYKQFLSLLLCALMIGTPLYTFFMGFTKAAAATQPVVFPVTQDAFVSNYSSQGNSLGITLNSNKLIYGKSRHTYLKFDLSSIDTKHYDIDQLRMNLSFRKTHAPNKLVFTESEETLRDSSVDWTKDNLNFNNRPNDVAGSPVVTQNVTSNGEETLSVDLSAIFQFALKNGRKVVSIHLTTADVNDGTIAASEMYSSRNTSGQPAPSLAVTLGEPVVNETPSQIAGPNMGDYFTDSKNAAMIFKMKNENGQYVKVDPKTEKLSLTANATESSTFALYVLDYFANVDHQEPEVGATRTAYSIKSLNNGKFLTIQNYFTAEEFQRNTHHYFNILNGAQSGFSTDRTFEIKASASIPGWNERFYVDHYANSGYYRIWSHLSTMRDDAEFNRYNVKMTGDSMQSSGTASENPEYRFIFEEVKGKDQLEINQEVSGKDADLFWRPINGDTNPANYKIKGIDTPVVYTDNLMRAKLTDLSVGSHKYTVEYTGDSYQVSTGVSVRIFNHPGILLSADNLNRMKQHVQAKKEPWYSDYQRLLNSVPYDLSSSDFVTTVLSNVGRGGAPSDSGNIGYFEKGGLAAYFNALQWVITGDNQYAEKAVDILNKWANGLKVIDGRDRILGAGINSYKYASAAEILRYYNGGYSGYSDADFNALKDMMINVVYPVIQDAAVPMYANGNWDHAAMVSMMAIGVLCDNTEIFDRAMAFYQDIHTNGSIFAYVNDSGQTMETGRDQAHAMLALGFMAEICLVAKNQNEDLYSLYDNRLAKAFEYSAKYNLYSKELSGEDVTFVAMPNVFGDTKRGYYGTGFDSETLNRGELRPVFEQALALYSKVDGVDLTWTKRAAAASRPQGMVHFDNLNFGTLTYYNGGKLEANGPYFQMRTRWEPLYQRNWSTVDGQKVAESLNSYFDMNENGELVTSGMKKDAPFFQLVSNDDNTYSIRLVKTNTYLSVKDDKVGDYNVIKADATKIGDHEKFILGSSGVGPYFLVSPKYDNRIVFQDPSGSGSSAVLTLRLGTKQLSQIKDTPNVSTNERLIFMYNTESIATDLTPPVTTDNAPKGWVNKNIAVSLNPTDDCSGVATTYYTVNDGPEQTGNKVTLTNEGRNKIVYWSVDHVGNVEEQKTTTVKIDKTGPEITIKGFEGDLSDDTDMVPDLTVKDSLSGVDDSKTQITLDGKSYTTDSSIEFYTLPLGRHTISVVASDLAGNSTTKTVTFKTFASMEGLKQLISRFEGKNWIDNQGIADSLQEKLNTNNLQPFINQVKAQEGKHINKDAAYYLLRDANALLN